MQEEIDGGGALTATHLSEIFDTIRKSFGRSIKSSVQKTRMLPFSWMAKLHEHRLNKENRIKYFSASFLINAFH